MTSSLPKSWNKLQEYDTVFSADSIEFCPISPHQHIFLCGTYQLTEKDESAKKTEKTNINKRKGTIILLELNKQNQLSTEISTLYTDAILDMKWCHCKINDRIVVGVVTAIGQILIYQLSPKSENKNYGLVEICKFQLDKESVSEILALSLDWSSRTLSNTSENISTDNIIVSDSQGSLNLFTFNSNELRLIYKWKSHEFECWIAAFNYFQSSTFYSGGDDCKLKVYDFRQKNVALTNSQHLAGVTSIQCNPFRENEIATGSYDEHLYLWDSRNMKSYRNQTNLGGGVWRIKYVSIDDILTATMYNGFHYINTTRNDSLHYNQHDGHIAYGIDACYSQKQLIVTCSFYNHLMNVSILK